MPTTSSVPVFQIQLGLMRQMFNSLRTVSLSVISYITCYSYDRLPLANKPAELNKHTFNRHWTEQQMKISVSEPVWWVSVMSFPLLPFCKQTQIPRLKSASELYNFKLSNNGKVSWRLAEAYAVADRILQIRRRLRRPQFFFQRIFGGG